MFWHFFGFAPHRSENFCGSPHGRFEMSVPGPRPLGGGSDLRAKPEILRRRLSEADYFPETEHIPKPTHFPEADHSPETAHFPKHDLFP